MNPRFVFIGGFLLTVGTISYYEIKQCHDLPWPPRIVATGAVFALLDVFSLVQPELAGIVAVGFALAMVLNTINPKITDGKLNAKVECDPRKRGCPCHSQAADMIGIPPPNVVPPNPAEGGKGPSGAPELPGLTPIEPPWAPILPPGGLPELPAIPV